MSGCPAPMPPQKICMPPPVPVDSTIGEGAPVTLENCSATAWVYGNTVDEPTMRIWSRLCAVAAPAPRARSATAETASLE